MALIQKIRSKSWLVLSLMVLAIVAFIGMLLTQDSNRSWNDLSNTTTVAKVAGQKLEAFDMERQMDAITFGQSADLNFRNSFVEYFINNALIEKEANALGLGVSIDELKDLVFGANPSRVVMGSAAVMDPSTGQPNLQALTQIRQAIQNNQLNPQYKLYWAELEKQVISERLSDKINIAISKGIYTPTWLVDEGYKDLTQPVDFEYVKVPFDRVDDKDAPVSDSDYEAYLAENKTRFTTEDETRTIEYAVFDVAPSIEDSMKLREKVLSLKENFRATDKDSAFAIANNGVIGEFFQKKSELAETVRDSLFSAPVGTVIGPYIEGKFYALAKVTGRRSAPDSVKSRHILLRDANAQKTADSLVAILRANPSQWDSLNQKFNTDETAKMTGGDMGYQPHGKFVAPYNDLIFYTAKQGEFNSVATQFGMHIVQVTGVKAGANESRVKVAYVREPIIPSSETDRKASIAADDLLTSSKNLEDLKKNAQAKGIQVQPASGFRAIDMSLGSFGQADGVRQMIRWAYEAKVGERSKTTFALREQGEGYNSKYVVAALKNIVPKGTPSVKELKEQLTPFVKNRKKGEVLKSKINTEDLNAIVSQYNTKVDTAKGVTFNATFVPNLGGEPRVIGAAFTTETGKTTKPIVGDGGVFVLKVTNKTTVENSPVQKDQLRIQMSAPIKNSIRGTLSRSLRKLEGVTDNRAKFF